MRVTLAAVGKLRDPGLEALCADYQKRVRPFMPVEVVELRGRAALRELWRKTTGVHVLLDERGEQLSTPELAAWIDGWRGAGASAVTFSIGDADGFDDDDRRGAARLLALSRLTLPHRLARLLLLEQLYRAATLLAGHPYHHA